MILVDSSVWIGYLRNGQNADIIQVLIENELICTNEIILAELIPNLQIQNKGELIETFLSFKCKPYHVFWEGLRAIQIQNLKNGINAVGIPDLMIAQHCIDDNLELWTLDKHFYLMNKHLHFKMFSI